MSEIIMIASIAVQAFATIVLVGVTYLLAKHTKALAHITEELAGIEYMRERRTCNEKERIIIAEVYELADSIVKINAGYFGVELFPGVKARKNSELIKKIYLLSSLIEDSITIELLHDLIRDISSVEGGAALGDNRVITIKKFESFQGRLFGMHMPKWRDKLVIKSEELNI
jgi:hypothetical protein